MLLVIDEDSNLFMVDEMNDQLLKDLDSGDVRAIKLDDLTESSAVGNGKVDWRPIHRMKEWTANYLTLGSPEQPESQV